MADGIQHSLPLNKKARFYLSSEPDNDPPSSEHLNKMASVPVFSSKSLARASSQSPPLISARSEFFEDESPNSSTGKYFAIPIGRAVHITPDRHFTQGEDVGGDQLKPMALLTSTLKDNVAVNTTSVWSSSSSSNASSSHHGCEYKEDQPQRKVNEKKENRSQSASGKHASKPPQGQLVNDGCYKNDGYCKNKCQESYQREHRRVYLGKYQEEYREQLEEIQYDQRAAKSDYAVAFNYGYPEFLPNARHIIRGGFGKLVEDEKNKAKLPKIGEFFTQFPPAMNKDYELTTDARDPKFVYTPPKLEFSSKQSSTPYHPIHLFPVRQLGIKDEEKAHNDMWKDKAIRLLGLGFPEARGSDERSEIYNKAFNIQKDSYGYCWRCNENHIEFGPPETLPDRDPCGAFLPPWYPAHHVENCWIMFRDLWKDIVYREETGRHFDSSRPRRPIWDKEYHEPDNKWKGLGYSASEGWWKCRSGPGATDAELRCVVCHRNRTVAQDDLTQRLLATKKNALVEWTHGHLRQLGVDDRPSAEGIVERMGTNKILDMPYFAPNDQRGRGFRPPRLIPDHMSPSPVHMEIDYKTAALEVLRQMPYPAILGKTYVPLGLARSCTYSSMNSQLSLANVKSYWDDGDPPTPVRVRVPDSRAKVTNPVEDDKQWETEDENASASDSKCASTISQFALGSPVRPIGKSSVSRHGVPGKQGEAAAGGDLLLGFPFAARTSPNRMSRLN